MNNQNKEENYFVAIYNNNGKIDYKFLISGLNQEVSTLFDSEGNVTHSINEELLEEDTYIIKITNEDYDDYWNPSEDSHNLISSEKIWQVRKDCPLKNSLEPVSLFSKILESVEAEKPEQLDPQDVPLTPREQHALKEAIEFLTIEALRK